MSAVATMPSAAPPGDSPVRRHGSEGDEAPSADLYAAPFAVLLRTSRTGLTHALQSRGFEKAAAGQMFEPQSTNPANDGRRRALRVEQSPEEQTSRTDAARTRYARAEERYSTSSRVGSAPASMEGSLGGRPRANGRSAGRHNVSPEPPRPTKLPDGAANLRHLSRSPALTASKPDNAGMGQPIASSGPAPSAAPLSSRAATAPSAASAAVENGRAKSGHLARQIGQALSTASRGDHPESTRGSQDPPQPQTPSERSSPARSRASADAARYAHRSAEGKNPASPEASRFDDLVRSIRLHAGTRFSSARMHLKPPEMGRMRVDVRLEGDRLAVEVRTETRQATDLVHDRITELRAALSAHGLLIDRFDVLFEPASEVHRHVAQQHDHPWPNPRRHWENDADDEKTGVYEGTEGVDGIDRELAAPRLVRGHVDLSA